METYLADFKTYILVFQFIKPVLCWQDFHLKSEA